MSEFYTKILKWRRDPVTGDHHARAGDTKYRISREDGGGGKGWLVGIAKPGRSERYLRPLCKTVKLAKESAEREAYWEHHRYVLAAELRDEADAITATLDYADQCAKDNLE